MFRKAANHNGDRSGSTSVAVHEILLGSTETPGDKKERRGIFRQLLPVTTRMYVARTSGCMYVRIYV